jgi:hypothetical protein
MSMEPDTIYRYHEVLVELALDMCFAATPPTVQESVRPQLLANIRKMYARLSIAERKLLRTIRISSKTQRPRGPPEAIQLLRAELGGDGLTEWAFARYPALAKTHTHTKLRERILAWLAGQPQEMRNELLEAGIRYGAGDRPEGDIKQIESTLGPVLSEKEERVAERNFAFDVNSLPRGFDQSSYRQAVVDELKNNLRIDDTEGNRVVQAAIIGLLLLDEQFDYTAPGFPSAIHGAWQEFLGRTVDYTGTTQYHHDVYARIDQEIQAIRASNNGTNPASIFYQELAWTGRYVIKTLDQIPPEHPNFRTQVRLGLDSYVAGKPAFESLDLPPLTGDDGATDEIEPDNIRAVALIYASYQLEQLKLFQVVERVTELFMDGLLTIGFDAGGRALDTYYWSSEDRLSEAARYMQYSRVLGVRGGDVSREVKPNTEFEGLFLRFLSSLSEYDRQQRVADLFDTRRSRSLSLTGEHIRKAGRDLAANASVYGYAYTHFAARRINQHIASVIDILKQPSIQRAHGVDNPWRVIERVSAREFGQVPNIVRYRTMADAGKKILDIVARYAAVWTSTSGRPLFPEFNGYGDPGPSDISADDQRELMRQTEYWIAVNGIKDDQVDQYSQPVESTVAPSIPAYGGGNGVDSSVDQLRQMVAAGQTPTLDQLKQLLPAGVGV